MHVTEERWESLHQAYIQFAFSPMQDYRRDGAHSSHIGFADRRAIETIRYSYDALAASVEFIFHCGEKNQLRIPIKNNWLARHLRRKWKELALADKIGLLS